jgi:hypothetical protein
MSESIILKAQSLCNYALDGAGPDMTGRDALDECLKDLEIAIEIRARRHDSQLAETQQAMGYVHYVRATCIMEKPPEDHALYSSDPYETPQMLYKKCLEPYFECMGLYHARDGPDAETTLRMQCNLALVYGQLSRVEPQTYVETAEMYYLRAIEESTRISGKTHRRSRRLLSDLKEVRARKDKLQEALDEGRAVVSESTLRANLSDAEILEQRKREEEAAKLMAEFLAARKQERKTEQHLRQGERAAAATCALTQAAAALVETPTDTDTKARHKDTDTDTQTQSAAPPNNGAGQGLSGVEGAGEAGGAGGVGGLAVSTGSEKRTEESRCSKLVSQQRSCAPEEDSRHRLPRPSPDDPQEIGAPKSRAFAAGRGGERGGKGYTGGGGGGVATPPRPQAPPLAEFKGAGLRNGKVEIRDLYS